MLGNVRTSYSKLARKLAVILHILYLLQTNRYYTRLAFSNFQRGELLRVNRNLCASQRNVNIKQTHLPLTMFT